MTPRAQTATPRALPPPSGIAQAGRHLLELDKGEATRLVGLLVEGDAHAARRRAAERLEGLAHVVLTHVVG